MAAEPLLADTGAMLPFAPGPVLDMACGRMRVEVAPEAGGRIAQIRRDGVAQLAGFDASNTAMIGWGCYPMLPWAGRVRNGAFEFGGEHHQLPLNLGAHSIHGVGFAMPWQVEFHDARLLELSLALPQDRRWPFGGSARQRIELDGDSLMLRLSVQAATRPMPATLGWHPWFRKPSRLVFSPAAMYPRDRDGIATLPLAAPSAGPWDDCFVHDGTVVLENAGQSLSLESDCRHWVVYDEGALATCVEPQSGPPDAFNLEPFALMPGQTLSRWFRMGWADR
ncbi:MAG: aldose epimerase [Lysobacteraceae bacterium]|nr:MAG: aldose epimerase [Xanthomonadaceae bacterium]